MRLPVALRRALPAALAAALAAGTAAAAPLHLVILSTNDVSGYLEPCG